MSHTEILKPRPHVTLKLSFDADQNGSELVHSLVADNPGTPDPNPTHGPYADSLYFAPGEQVSVQITCSGSRAKRFDSFQIIDCVFITRPQVVQRGRDLPTRYAAPSPFLQAIGACFPMALDFYAVADNSGSGIEPIHTDERIVTQYWKRTLDIGLTPGLWSLSFAMTVRITRGLGSVDEIRVFSFDPEAEVGGAGTVKR
ncbi:MAG: hypothetical protein V4631_08870 [Pseudomonadota bacterium]